MKADHEQRRERLVAGLLRTGTGIASAVVAAGMVLDFLPRLGLSPSFNGGSALVKTGVALFILLPITRVALMLVLFLLERDYLYVAISALVLAIIAFGLFLGI